MDIPSYTVASSKLTMPYTRHMLLLVGQKNNWLPTDRPSECPTDQPTDTPPYRFASSWLKINLIAHREKCGRWQRHAPGLNYILRWKDFPCKKKEKEGEYNLIPQHSMKKKWHRTKHYISFFFRDEFISKVQLFRCCCCCCCCCCCYCYEYVVTSVGPTRAIFFSLKSFFPCLIGS